jgi:hypothetical protein
VKELRLKERGPHHAKYERVIEEVGPHGEVRQRVEPGYVELASGLHYWEDGEWKPTEETIEVFAGGAIARKGPHKVIFAHNLATLGAIDLETPDGLRLRSHVLGLVYQDAATGRSVIVAEVKDATGEVLPPNQVIYRDAFKGVRADVRYTYTKAGFEQDIILREKLPHAPEDYGLSSRTTRLVVLTEFEQPPTPVVQALPTQEGADVAVRFGQMEIGRGKAFELGARRGPALRRGEVPVNKRWVEQDGRKLLLEEVPLPAVREALDKLPEQSAVEPVEQTWTAGLTVPPRPRPLGEGERRPLLTAAVAVPEPGFVLDYVLLNASVTNYIFQGDTTYHVSGIVNLYGSTTLEGGAVIKFNPATPSGLRQQGGAIVTLTGPYRPVVFTSGDDNSVGETIPGSSGNPVRRGDDNYYLELRDLTNISLAHLRFAFDSCPLTVVNGSATLNDLQFVDCAYPVYGVGASLTFNNLLVHNCSDDVFWLQSSTTHVAQATLHQCANLWVNWASALALTNSLLVNVGTIGTAGLTTNAVVITNGSVFTSAGAGYHYLPTNSPYRNVGTTNLSPALHALLAQRTTHAPVVYSNLTVTTNLTLGTRVPRGTNAVPDLGYHYPPLDYITHHLIVTNASVLVTNSVALASYHDSGIVYWNGLALHVEGTPTQPVWITRYHCVQERPVFLGNNSPLPFNPYHTHGDGPVAVIRQARFTGFTGANDYHLYHQSYNWSFASLVVRDCEFYNSRVQVPGNTNTIFFAHNNLLRRTPLAAPNGFASWANWLSLSNNLIWRATVRLGAAASSNQWHVFDNAFDHCNFLATNNLLLNGCNAYINCSNRLYPVSWGDQGLSTFPYTNGPLGNFYHAGTDLADIGSTSPSAAGLYHYTTAADQTKEGTTWLDVGYHYVAVNANGLPLDSDGDGIPDYLEDADGDGNWDAGETNWANPDTDHDGLPDGVDADPWTPDTSPPVFVILTPLPGTVF